MRTTFICLLIGLLGKTLSGQEADFSPLAPLVGKVWVAEGKWGDGSTFKQEKSFSYHLEAAIITSESLGFTNEEQTTFGPRNHGVYSWDTKSKQILFKEYDAFGGLTEGTVKSEGQNILFQYEYGGTQLTDAWLYENDTTYQFVVGTYEKGSWTKKYLETSFSLKKSFLNLPDFSTSLTGKWTSPAWEGELEENWQLDQNGQMVSTALYLENGDTLYASQTFIQHLSGEWILLSVIKDSPPKVFKAISWDETKMVFENPDYENPSRVTYEFVDDNTFLRTISWKLNGVPDSYTFHFSRKE